MQIDLCCNIFHSIIGLGSVVYKIQARSTGAEADFFQSIIPPQWQVWFARDAGLLVSSWVTQHRSTIARFCVDISGVSLSLCALYTTNVAFVVLYLVWQIQYYDTGVHFIILTWCVFQCLIPVIVASCRYDTETPIVCHFPTNPVLITCVTCLLNIATCPGMPISSCRRRWWQSDFIKQGYDIDSTAGRQILTSGGYRQRRALQSACVSHPTSLWSCLPIT